MLHDLSVHLVLSDTKLNTVLEMQPHQCYIQRDNHLSSSDYKKANSMAKVLISVTAGGKNAKFYSIVDCEISVAIFLSRIVILKVHSLSQRYFKIFLDVEHHCIGSHFFYHLNISGIRRERQRICSILCAKFQQVVILGLIRGPHDVGTWDSTQNLWHLEYTF